MPIPTAGRIHKVEVKTLSTTTTAPRVDVAVVGCGTTGLTLARLLSMEGLSVALIDHLRIPRGFPRAMHLDDETMRSFQTIGMAHFEKTFSLPGVYRFYDAQWRPVMEFPFNRGVTEQGWQSDYMFHQPDFEAALRGHAQKDPKILQFFGWEAIELVTSEDGVRLRLRERTSRAEQEVRTTYLVGCDGANSSVRATMGCTQVNYHATHRSLIVDIVPFTTKETLSSRDSFIHAGIRNPLTFVGVSDSLLRFEELLRPDDDTAAFESLDHVCDLLSQWLSPEEYRILRADVYEWDAVVAEPWSTGPFFLAGDAAHEMPPHLGQGMTSGIRDAMNLAWKLGRVVRGESDAGLLSTYESERKPHMSEFVALAAQMANQVEAMEPVGTEEGEEVPVTELETLRPRLGAGVWAPSDEFGGLLSAQPTLADGQRLDDVTGYRFALLVAAECVDDIGTKARSSLDSVNASVILADSTEARRWLDSLPAVAVLIRPDRYIFGTAATALDIDDLVALLAESLQQRPMIGSGVGHE
jgi:3-(3-hydroxy-phenyl)propionate hydroxylase